MAGEVGSGGLVVAATVVEGDEEVATFVAATVVEGDEEVATFVAAAVSLFFFTIKYVTMAAVNMNPIKSMMKTGSIVPVDLYIR